MEWMIAYLVIGMVLALTPRLPDEYEPSIMIIGLIFVVVFWPIYLIGLIVGRWKQ